MRTSIEEIEIELTDMEMEDAFRERERSYLLEDECAISDALHEIAEKNNK